MRLVVTNRPQLILRDKLFDNKITRHRASTSMYSLTFCVRFLLPERHQWKPEVQTAAVMLRTPPVAGGPAAPSSPMRRVVLGAPAGRRRAQTPPSRPFAPCHVAGWTQACNWGSRYVAIATQPFPCPDCKSAQYCTVTSGSVQ